MGATQPARDRPRPATPVPRARRQPPRCPRRWGRLLAAGAALVLVAALMPRALADPNGGEGSFDGGDVAFFGASGEASDAQLQAEQVPADAALTIGGGGGDDRALSTGDASQVPNQDAQANRQPPVDGQTQPGNTEQVTEKPDQADASQSKGSRDDTAGCADGSCSKKSLGNPAGMVWSDENGDDGDNGDDGYEDEPTPQSLAKREEKSFQSLPPERKIDFIEQRI